MRERAGRQAKWPRELSRALLATVAVAALAGCTYPGGRASEPNKPSGWKSLEPDTAGIATFLTVSGCRATVTLDGGQSVDVVNGYDEQCPGSAATPLYLDRYVGDGQSLRRDGTYEPGKAPLIVSGMDGGTRWVGVVSRVNSGNGCNLIRLKDADGAWLEGDRVHLAAGILLDAAPGFKVPSYPADAFPLRRDDSLCLDDEGRVTSVEIWFPY